MGPINAISSDPQGIGYSVFFYASFMLPDENVRLLGIEGVVPTSETIASREYPLVTEVYAVVRAAMPTDSTAVMLRDWLLTEEGQEAVEESGYVPIR
jgi:phosphate transport system substrate-binding protein